MGIANSQTQNIQKDYSGYLNIKTVSELKGLGSKPPAVEAGSVALVPVVDEHLGLKVLGLRCRVVKASRLFFIKESIQICTGLSRLDRGPKGFSFSIEPNLRTLNSLNDTALGVPAQ